MQRQVQEKALIGVAWGGAGGALAGVLLVGLAGFVSGAIDGAPVGFKSGWLSAWLPGLIIGAIVGAVVGGLVNGAEAALPGGGIGAIVGCLVIGFIWALVTALVTATTEGMARASQWLDMYAIWGWLPGLIGGGIGGAIYAAYVQWTLQREEQDRRYNAARRREYDNELRHSPTYYEYRAPQIFERDAEAEPEDSRQRGTRDLGEVYQTWLASKQALRAQERARTQATQPKVGLPHPFSPKDPTTFECPGCHAIIPINDYCGYCRSKQSWATKR